MSIQQQAARRAEQLLAENRPSKAARVLQAAADSSAPAPYWLLLGHALRLAGEPLPAWEALQCALHRDNSLLPARLAGLQALSEAGQLTQALHLCQQWCTEFPDSPDLHTAQAWLLRSLQQTDAALTLYRHTLERWPAHLPAREKACLLLQQQGQLFAALALADDGPDDLPHRLLQAECLLATGQAQQAVARLSQTDTDTPPEPLRLALLGIAAACAGDMDTAGHAFSQAPETARQAIAKRAPGWSAQQCEQARLLPETLALHYLNEQRCHASWHDPAHCAPLALDTLPAPLGDPPDNVLWFQALWRPHDRMTLRERAEALAARLPATPVRQANTARADGPYRIGLLSADWCPHPAPRLILPLLRHASPRVRYIRYASAPPVAYPPVVAMQAHAPLVDLSRLSDLHAAQRIAADQLDLLIDLSGWTSQFRPALLKHRPAPRQLGWLGYFSTCGGAGLDHVLLDPIMAPQGEDRYWWETLLRMPETLWLYDDQQAIAATPSRSELGLPEQGFVFCSIHSDYKLDPTLFAAWMQLLHAVPGSVLWQTPRLPAVAEHLRREAKRHGIPPERLIFSPYEPDLPRYLARYHQADLFLDTACCNTGTTLLDALYSGLPTLTLCGNTPSTRKGASILHALGLDTLICHSLADYSARALQLAREPQGLAALRQQVQHARQRPPLNSRLQAQQLENMWCHVIETCPAH
ncbi:hypothetical protein [Leeia sp.]|uniref:O-linked N-acetylglucosamine transferase, SPINDLY family protein n=1 Tax=Leeia sp. TaxID=2884678 RepID=UPI0035B1AD34